VVGEVRGAEVVDMLLALSSGHRGCWSTVHATSASDTLERIAAMVLRDSPQWTHEQAMRTIHGAIGAVIHLQRTAIRRREIVDIVRIDSTGHVEPLYRRDPHD
jgi:pilus assembly protein CpaF